MKNGQAAANGELIKNDETVVNQADILQASMGQAGMVVVSDTTKAKAEQWAAFRFPIWMRIVGIFVPSVKTKYQQNFERRLSNAIHVTTKAVTHKVARRPA